MLTVYGANDYKLDPALDKIIREYLISKYPNEACGYIQGNEFFPVENVSPNPRDEFMFDPKRWLEVSQKQSVTIVHSHPEWFPVPSEADMAQQAAMQVPWLIYGLQKHDGGIDVSAPVLLNPSDNLNVPLVGRPFIHGVTDCYEMIRGWYFQTLNITLPQFDRDWEWWRDGSDLYSKGFGPAGFRVIDMTKSGNEPMMGDVFLAHIRSPKVINHGGVYLGKGLGLHHLTGRSPFDPSMLSKADPIIRYMSYITLWVRHESNSAGN